MDQWMGNVFYRGASPLEVESMAFHQIAYWNAWHKAMSQKESSIIKES